MPEESVWVPGRIYTVCPEDTADIAAFTVPNANPPTDAVLSFPYTASTIATFPLIAPTGNAIEEPPFADPTLANPPPGEYLSNAITYSTLLKFIVSKSQTVIAPHTTCALTFPEYPTVCMEI
jgi:hypothetical protein